MKTSQIVIIFIIAGVFIACNGKKTENKTETTKTESEFVLKTETPADYTKVDLSEYGYPLTVMVPPDADIYTSTLITDEATEKQVVVQLNAASDVRLNIHSNNTSIDEYRKEAKTDFFRDFDRFILENENQFVYKASHDKNDTCFYLVCLVKNGDKSYAIISDSFKDYGFSNIQQLFYIANSVKPIH